MVSSPFQLTLTPHELFALPPDTPATGPAIRVEVTWRDEPAFFALARLVYIRAAGQGYKSKGDIYRIFLRDEQRAEDAIFGRGQIFLKEEDCLLSEEELLRRISNSVNRGGFTRFWKSPELPYCLALNSLGRGFVISQRDQKASGGDFQVEEWDRNRFWEWDTNEFHSFCQKLVSDSESELNVFLRWQKLSPEEKTSLATTCELGDLEQLKHLLTWVLQLVVYHFGSYPYVYGNGQSSFWHYTREIPTMYDRPAVFFARRWQNVIFGIVRPNFWKPPPTLYWPALDTMIVCETPTAHEFLEAQLGLREFLRPHLSVGEIEALLSPESEGLLP
ncbi:hypothetical protein IAD21_05265 [Abditibacteriota bacterium]|nr:hypothetical protein IAD21_05265 [Abditibacteriota bacterium]